MTTRISESVFCLLDVQRARRTFSAVYTLSVSHHATPVTPVARDRGQGPDPSMKMTRVIHVSLKRVVRPAARVT